MYEAICLYQQSNSGQPRLSTTTPASKRSRIDSRERTWSQRSQVKGIRGSRSGGSRRRCSASPNWGTPTSPSLWNRTRLLGADPAAASIRAKNKKPKEQRGEGREYGPYRWKCGGEDGRRQSCAAPLVSRVVSSAQLRRPLARVPSSTSAPDPEGERWGLKPDRNGAEGGRTGPVFNPGRPKRMMIPAQTWLQTGPLRSGWNGGRSGPD